MSETERESRGFNAGGVGAGLVVLALGVLMFLDQQGYAHYNLMRFFPGVALIALGTASLTNNMWCERRRRPFGGLWLIMIGAWMIVSEGHLFGLTYRTTWPLFIVGAGMMILLGALFPRPPVSVRKEQDGR